MNQVTIEDLNTLRYFWEDKADITRWVGFEKLLPALEQEYPEILKAWKDYQTADRTLTAILRGLTT